MSESAIRVMLENAADTKFQKYFNTMQIKKASTS